MKEKKEKRRHFLIMEKELFERIEKNMKAYRPYMESRNGFICQLLVLGLQKLKEKEGEGIAKV